MNEFGEHWPETADEDSMVANYVWGQLELKGGLTVRSIRRQLQQLSRESNKAERRGDIAEMLRLGDEEERLFQALDYLCGPPPN